MTPERLWPRPQSVRTGIPALQLGSIRLHVVAELPETERLALLARLRRELSTCGLRGEEANGAGSARLELRLESRLGGPERYRLRVDSTGILLTAGSAPGLFRGICTLGRWLRLHESAGEDGLAIDGVEIEDWPDLPQRGVMLDISRDKVPKLETLETLIYELAGLGINQLQLYTEHTFAYAGHEAVWREWSPLTAADAAKLDELCRAQFIELVPNQNSFGHLHRWLVHEPYRQLAECPGGFPHPFSPFSRDEPFSLCPGDPGSLELLADLYDQLLPNFTSGLFNVGCDETFDLGKGRSQARCDEVGRGRVYLDFLSQVHGLVSARGRRMQFWGDIILEHPELIGELPRDAIALQWGYEANHPFAEHSRHFAESGRDFYVCPGTSSWNSFAGRTTNALENLASAARHGVAAGASGYLITDWGDFGHLQPLPASYLGLLAGAGFAWNVATAAEPNRLTSAEGAARLDLSFFRGSPGLGAAASELGDAYRLTGTPSFNGSALFFLVVFAHQTLEERRYRGLDQGALEAVAEHVADQREHLARLEVAPDQEQARDELLWVADTLLLAQELGRERLAVGRHLPLAALPPRLRHELAERIAELAERRGELWRARNREGGLADALRYLERPRDWLRDA